MTNPCNHLFFDKLTTNNKETFLHNFLEILKHLEDFRENHEEIVLQNYICSVVCSVVCSGLNSSTILFVLLVSKV